MRYISIIIICLFHLSITAQTDTILEPIWKKSLTVEARVIDTIHLSPYHQKVLPQLLEIREELSNSQSINETNINILLGAYLPPESLKYIRMRLSPDGKKLIIQKNPDP